MSGAIERVLDVLRERCDIDFTCYEPATLARSIRRRMETLGQSDAAYAEMLRANPVEIDTLYHEALIGATEFFRDAEAYAQLGRVIHGLMRNSDGELRAWVAGCATGEEVYSVAMLLDEAREQLKWFGRIRMFATDVHQEVLKQAAQGVFSPEALSRVSAQRRRRHFIKEADHFRVTPDLRSLVTFANHNLAIDSPFTHLDLVCCRNVLSYFEPATRASVLEQFRGGLRAGGLLFLGRTESLGALADEFEPVDADSNLFMKRRKLLGPELAAEPESAAAPAPRSPSARPREGERANRPRLAVYEALLDRFMPAVFVLDAEMKLRHCFGGAERYLRVEPERRDSLALTSLLDGPLRGAVSEMLERYRRDAAPHAVDVSRDAMRGRRNGYRVKVSPLELANASSPAAVVVEIRPLS